MPLKFQESQARPQIKSMKFLYVSAVFVAVVSLRAYSAPISNIALNARAAEPEPEDGYILAPRVSERDNIIERVVNTVESVSVASAGSASLVAPRSVGSGGSVSVSSAEKRSVNPRRVKRSEMEKVAAE